MPTESVILTFDSTPPSLVFVGIKSHKTKLYCPLPIRCFKCQRLGHVQAACNGRLTCPKCAGPHGFNDCPLNNPQLGSSNSVIHSSNLVVKCCNCNGPHSAAYWGCPKFLERKKNLELKTLNKVPFGEAVSQYNELITIHDPSNNVGSDISQELNEVFQMNRGNGLSDSTNKVIISDHDQELVGISQDNATSNAPSFVNNNLSNRNENSAKMMVSTPWKTNYPLLSHRTQMRRNLSTVQEEREFHLLGASKVDSKKELETLLDKFLKFMANLYLELLPFSCVRDKFHNLTELLNQNEQSIMSGGFFL